MRGPSWSKGPPVGVLEEHWLERNVDAGERTPPASAGPEAREEAAAWEEGRPAARGGKKRDTISVVAGIGEPEKEEVGEEEEGESDAVTPLIPRFGLAAGATVVGPGTAPSESSSISGGAPAYGGWWHESVLPESAVLLVVVAVDEGRERGASWAGEGGGAELLGMWMWRTLLGWLVVGDG